MASAVAKTALDTAKGTLEKANQTYTTALEEETKAKAKTPTVQTEIDAAIVATSNALRDKKTKEAAVRTAEIAYRKALVKDADTKITDAKTAFKTFDASGDKSYSEIEAERIKIEDLKRKKAKLEQDLEIFTFDKTKKPLTEFDLNPTPFRYQEDLLLRLEVDKDLDYITQRWEEVKKTKVDDEAKRTNNWSLIWKLKSIQKELIRIERNLKDDRNILVVEQGIVDISEEQKEVLRNGSREELDDLYEQWTNRQSATPFYIKPFLLGVKAGFVVGSAIGTASSKITSGAGSAFRWIKSFWKAPPPGASTGTTKPTVETTTGFFNSGLKFKNKGTDAPEINEKQKRIVIVRERIINVTDQLQKMFTEMKRWISVCGGQIYIPEKAPEFKGLDHLASRISEWFVWPQVQPALFPLQRQVLLYGPAKSGKTVLANLASFEAAKKLREAYEKSTKDVKPINDFAVVYLVDAEKLKSDKMEVSETRLKNYFNCLQFEISQLKETNPQIEPMAVLILDNVDSLFEKPMVKVGGDGSVLSATDIFSAILNPDRLATEWPSVRIIWSMKYPWNIPKSILPPNYQKYSLFVDLPSLTTRQSIIQLAIQNDMSQNIADYLDQQHEYQEEVNEPASKEAKEKYENVLKLDSDRPCFKNKTALCIVQEDDNLFEQERKIRDEIKVLFLGERNKKTGFDQAKAALSDLIFGKSLVPLGGLRGKQIVYKLLFDDPKPEVKLLVKQYMQLMASTIEFLVNATGMSLEGYCRLQTDSGLTHSEVDMFMTVTRRDSLLGRTPFGFTIQELVQFYGILKQSVSTKQLSKALNDTNSYIKGYEKFHSQACKLTSEKETNKPLSIQEPDCEIALGTDLMNTLDGTPVLPLSSRFGSHRFLKEDVMKALNSYEKYMKPKTDYPEFVTYVLLKVPKTNRTSISPKDISQKCMIQPGPSSRAKQMSSNGETFVDSAYLATWTPTQRVAGSAQRPVKQLSPAAIDRRRKLSKLMMEK